MNYFEKAEKMGKKIYSCPNCGNKTLGVRGEYYIPHDRDGYIFKEYKLAQFCRECSFILEDIPDSDPDAEHPFP